MSYECPICGEKLCSEQELEIHIRIHTDDHTPIASNTYNQEKEIGMHNPKLNTIIQHSSFDSFSSAIEISVSVKYISLVCDVLINNCITIL